MKINSNFLNTAARILQIILMAVLIFFVVSLRADLNKLNSKISHIMSSNTPPPPPGSVALKPDEDAPAMGDASAKVVMTVISDFECGYCKVFAEEILPRLKKEYVNSGKLWVIFRDLPLEMHKNAFSKAEAAACANQQGKFWELHDHLFKNQKESGADFFNSWAKQADIDVTEFNSCLQNHLYHKEIEDDIKELNEAGIHGTPAIIINNKLTLGIRPYQYFKEIIDKEIKACGEGEDLCE